MQSEGALEIGRVVLIVSITVALAWQGRVRLRPVTGSQHLAVTGMIFRLRPGPAKGILLCLFYLETASEEEEFPK